MRMKFFNYFFYAVVGGENLSDSAEGCMEECGLGDWQEKCCAAVTMK